MIISGASRFYIDRPVLRIWSIDFLLSQADIGIDNVSVSGYNHKGTSKNREDHSCSYEESLCYADYLFNLIHDIADIENNKCAKYIYNHLYNYCINKIDERNKKMAPLFYNTANDWLVHFIAPFIYVFYVTLICHSFKSTKSISRSDAADLFVDIFCSKTLLDHFKDTEDFKFDYTRVVESKSIYIVNTYYGDFSFDPKIPKHESEFAYKKRINEALMNLVDSISINNAGEKLQNGKLTATPNFEERTSENLSGSKKESSEPIIECDGRINFRNLTLLIDKSKLDMHSHCWFIRWFVKQGIFILKLPEIAE